MTPEYHWHLCEDCRTVWGHEPAEGETHMCPVCTAGPWKTGYLALHQAIRQRKFLRERAALTTPA